MSTPKTKEYRYDGIYKCLYTNNTEIFKKYINTIVKNDTCCSEGFFAFSSDYIYCGTNDEDCYRNMLEDIGDIIILSIDDELSYKELASITFTKTNDNNYKFKFILNNQKINIILKNYGDDGGNRIQECECTTASIQKALKNLILPIL